MENDPPKRKRQVLLRIEEPRAQELELRAAHKGYSSLPSYVLDQVAEDETTVYRFYNSDKVLLYVGVTGDFGRRRAQHKTTKPWWPEVALTTQSNIGPAQKG